jgi:hypothetical protein
MWPTPVSVRPARSRNASRRTGRGWRHSPCRPALEILEDKLAPAGVFPQFNLTEPTTVTINSQPVPLVAGSFGTQVVTLSTGNIVVTDPTATVNGNADAGALFLYSGQTGALLFSLVGKGANENLGSNKITTLSNGNYVVAIPDDTENGQANAGAVILCSGQTGAELSLLTGSHANDEVGSGGIIVLTNGNFVVESPGWNGGRGAATWGSGTAGVSGVVSATNSLVGNATTDDVGSGVSVGRGIIPLPNGNYVVCSPYWTDGSAASAGAATWVNGTNGQVADYAQQGDQNLIDGQNSLVGVHQYDNVGEGGAVALANGNYVVVSENWNNCQGAVTWVNGTNGQVADYAQQIDHNLIDSQSSLTGSNQGTGTGDFVGGSQVGPFAGVTALPNGNYVVASPSWDGNLGAVTWMDGSDGHTLTYAQRNSQNVIDSNDSLIGSSAGTLQQEGYVSVYVGGDEVGWGGITVLANGNYVVSSPYWGSARGATTWGSETTGVVGTISATNNNNSFEGTTSGTVQYNFGTTYVGGDQVGKNFATAKGVTALANGDYVIDSPLANGDSGVVVWGPGTNGGVIGFDNDAGEASLLGTQSGDEVGSGGVTALTNGNFVVASPLWNNKEGAVTWLTGSFGFTNDQSSTIDGQNSLLGSAAGDELGSNAITALNNGNYAVGDPTLTVGGKVNAGAVYLMNGQTGGEISDQTAGLDANDKVGGGTITALSNSNFVVTIPTFTFNGQPDAGAVVLVDGQTGALLSELAGTSENDDVGSGGVTLLPDGDYVVSSPNWNGGEGAVTWGSATTGVGGLVEVSAANSLVGDSSNAGLNSPIVAGPLPGSFIAAFVNDDQVIVGVPPQPQPPPPPPPSPAPPGPQQASPSAVFTFAVKEGKHWYLLVWNSDPADLFQGFLLLEGLSKQQAKELHLPSGFPALYLYLPPGSFELLPLPFTPGRGLTGFAF